MQKKHAIASAILGMTMASAAGVQAATTTVMASFTGNDCAGYFGSNFGACQIFVNDNGQSIQISPVIAKYEYDDVNMTFGAPEINPLYSSVDGSEFTLTGSDPYASGTWSYSQGTGDPFVRYWAVKAGNDNNGTGGFNLFWTVDDGFVTNGTCSGSATGSENYTLACLSAAQTVSAGAWSTPGDRTLSHIAFYDSEDPVFPPVPVPAAVWLFGSGLLGLIGVARRRSQA